ncbi:MAG: hypothetical protein ACFB15_17610 [Cyclobacteriaceae bacterium]
MKKVSKSQAYLLYRVQVTTEAALTVPELQDVLKQYNFPAKKVKMGQQLLSNVKELQTQQELLQKKAQKAQQNLRDARTAMQTLYSSHLEIARFVYRKDEEMQNRLELNGSRARQYNAWLNQVKKFYFNIDTERVAKYDLPDTEIILAKEKIDDLLTLEVLRNDARRRAQQASQAKQEAFLTLREWYYRFMRVSKVACEYDPQLMESLGVVVPS